MRCFRAGRVGGIHANSTYPANFIADNLAIELNVDARRVGVGREETALPCSSCIYPRFAPQPIKEEALLTGALEPNNEWYALAKITGIKLASPIAGSMARISSQSCRPIFYGPGDNYHPEDSHVPAALIRRFHEAKISGQPSATVWGSGKVWRSSSPPTTSAMPACS